MLELLIAWVKYKYSYTHDYAPLKDILQKQAKADSVRTLKDAPVPGTDNTVTTMLTGNYDSSKDNDKEDGWNLVTRGSKPQVKQTVTIYTTNSFKPLSTNNDLETNKQCNKLPQSNNPTQ